jgi:hypothetical protein
MPEILALRRLRQEDCEFEESLSYTARPYLKRQKKRHFIYTHYLEFHIDIELRASHLLGKFSSA